MQIHLPALPTSDINFDFPIFRYSLKLEVEKLNHFNNERLLLQLENIVILNKTIQNTLEKLGAGFTEPSQNSLKQLSIFFSVHQF